MQRQKGVPPMRPLFFDFSEDQQTFAIEDQSSAIAALNTPGHDGGTTLSGSGFAES
jgi:hypothetical protein